MIKVKNAVPEGGLEPPIQSPKDCVLPLHYSGINRTIFTNHAEKQNIQKNNKMKISTITAKIQLLSVSFKHFTHFLQNLFPWRLLKTHPLPSCAV